MTKRQEDAARLLAEGDLPGEQIAERVGVTRQTLFNWQKIPAFAARIAEHRETFKERALAEGFADKRVRVAALNTLGAALLTQISSTEFQSVIKVTEDGDAIYGFDRDRLREFRAVLDDIAKEMGDRRQGVDVRHLYDQAVDLLAREYGLDERGRAKLVDLARERQARRAS